jgi:DNA helicase-2/ATP-dependent DNA helicase PcrA
MEDFLADIALEPPAANVTENHPEFARDHVVLSTIHSAKGLEWRAVFLISAVDGRLPSSQAYGDENVLEEERRLFYVAVTRAKEFLYICSPQRVFDRRTGFHPTSLSLFLEELPPRNHLQLGDSAADEANIFSEAETTESAGFNLGDTVRHPFFGRGKVIALPDRAKVQIQFEDGSIRLLHLKYAPLQRVASIY